MPKKDDKLARLGQLLQLYHGFTAGEDQHAMQGAQLQAFQQQTGQEAQLNPIKLGLEQERLNGATAENQYNQQLRPEQLKHIAETIQSMHLANQKAEGLMGPDLQLAQAQAKHAGAGAEVAQKSIGSAVEKGQLDNQKTRSELDSSQVQREFERQHIKGMAQEQRQGAEAFPMKRMGAAVEAAHMSQGLPGVPTNIFDLMMQGSDYGGGAQPEPPKVTPSPDGKGSTPTAYGTGLQHEAMFNQGHLGQASMAQLHDQILAGMQANPAHQWPPEFQAMQFYNQDPGQFTVHDVPGNVAGVGQQVTQQPHAGSFWDTLRGTGGIARSVNDAAQQMQQAVPRVTQPYTDWSMYGATDLPQQVMAAMQHQKRLQQLAGNR